MRKTNFNWLLTLITVIGFAFYGNAQIIFEDNFSSDQGWTLTGSWERNTAVAEPSNDFTGEGFILANPLGTDYSPSMTREDATSPVFDCSAYTLSDSIVISLESFSGCESSSYDHMGIEVFDGTNWVSIWSNSASFQQDSWTNMIIDVTQYAAGNANFQIRFYMGTTDSSVQYSGFAIDNFKLVNITCPQPTNQNALNITAHTATLNWISGGSSNYNFVYGPQGFIMEDSTAIALTDTFYNVSNLNSETTYEFYVQDSCGAGDVSLWTGPYQFTTLISCPAPTNQNVVNITTNSATFTWITGGANNWNIVYGLQGFNINDSVAIAVTDTFYNANNLTSATTYEFYVQDSCGTGDASHWVGPYTFTTDCDAVSTYPWFEDFENGGIIPNCWINTPSTDNDLWKFTIPGTSYGEVEYGPASNGDHTSGSGYVAWIDDSQTPIANPTILETPIFDLSTLTTPEFSFWYWIGNNTNTSSLRIDVFDGTSWHNNIDSLTANGQWSRIIINLGSYTSNATKIRFTAYESNVSSSYQSDIAIDDIQIREAPSCPEPYSLNASNIGLNNATLTWIPFGSESEWNVEYDTTGFNLGTGNNTNLTDTFIVLNTLNPGTSYDFYVQAVCGVGDESVWVGPYTFTTPSLGNTCSAPISVTLPADFTANVWEDLSQTTVDRGNNNDTTCLGYYDGGEDIFYEFTVTEDMVVNITMDPKTTTYTGIVLASGCPSSSNCIETSTISGTGIHSFNEISLTTGSYFIMIDTWPSPNNIPDFDLTIERITCPAPTNLGVDNLMANQADLTWTTGGASTWNVLFGIAGFDTTGLGPLATDITTNPLTVDTLIPETTYEFYVRDKCAVDDSSYWVGPFQFTTTASCPIPTDLGLANLGATSADLSWNGYFASTWDILFGVAGFDTTGLTPTVDNTTNNPFTIDTLTPNTSYDFYVRADCGSDSSLWVGPYTFTTNCVAITSYPYVESFEAGAISNCWNQEQIVGTSLVWTVETSGTSPTVSPYDGSNLLKLNCYSASSGETRLSTVNFDLTGQSTPHLDFFMIHDDGYTSNDDRVIVQISTDGVNWTNIDTISRYQAISATWTEYNYDLSSYIGQTIQVGLYGITEYGNNIFIDKLMIYNQMTDLTIVNPGNQDYSSCYYTGQDTIPFNINNVGSSIISANDTIYGWYELDGATAVADTFILAANLSPTDTAFFNFAQTVDLSDGTTHNLKVYMEYANDANQVNDTTNSTFTLQNPTISINQGDTMIIASSDFPKILSVGNTFESYFWYNEDSTVTGTNVQLIINDFGTYVINATDSNGCVASDTIWVLELVGINSIDNININIYPNPNNGEFTLNANFNTAIDFTVDMINIDGKTIYSKKFNGIKALNENIDVDSYAKGIYYIRISNKSFVKQEKVVIY